MIDHVIDLSTVERTVHKNSRNLTGKHEKKAKNAQYKNRSVLTILSRIVRIGIFVRERKGPGNLNIVCKNSFYEIIVIVNAPQRSTNHGLCGFFLLFYTYEKKFSLELPI